MLHLRSVWRRWLCGGALGAGLLGVWISVFGLLARYYDPFWLVTGLAGLPRYDPSVASAIGDAIDMFALGGLGLSIGYAVARFVVGPIGFGFVAAMVVSLNSLVLIPALLNSSVLTLYRNPSFLGTQLLCVLGLLIGARHALPRRAV